MNRVVVFGTFDIFHPGHISFLKQAKGRGGFLLVVIARDKNVAKVKTKLPKNPEQIRARTVRSSRLADKVVLGSHSNNYFRTLRTHKIDTIALGYDQEPGLRELRRQLRRHRLGHLNTVRLRGYNPAKYKSSKLSTNV